MSYTMRFVVAPLPASDDTLFDNIKEAATRFSRPQSTLTTNTNIATTPTTTTSTTASTSSTCNTQATLQLTSTSSTTTNAATKQTSFSAIKSVPVSQITVGPRHIALLLEDGRVCRVAYQVLADRLEFPATSNQPTSCGASHHLGGSSSSSCCVNPQASNISSANHQPAVVQQASASSAAAAVANSSLAAAAAAVSSLAPNSQHHHHHQHHHTHHQHHQQHQQQQPHPNATAAALNKTPLGTASSSSVPPHAPVPTNSTPGNPATNPVGVIGSSAGATSASGAYPPGVVAAAAAMGVAMDARNAALGGVLAAAAASSSTSALPNPNSATGGVASSSSLPPSSSVQPFPGRVNISPPVGGLSAHHRQAARRGRMIRQTANRGRATTSVIMGSRAVIPAQYVPEDLINQAQVVLQGKPRSAIVRELQRTNLDVNSAVNNLLSSDNEDPEDVDESQDYLPNEDLMSLLDSSVSLPSGPTSVLIDAETVFPEDVFNSYSASRIRPNSIRHSVGSSRNASDRESSLASELEIRRMSRGDPSQSRRWLEHALRDPPVSDSSNNRLNSATPTDFTIHHKHDSQQSPLSKKNQNNSLEASPIQISDTIEIWPINDKKFSQIASMHSELIAISSTGQIHQWKWSEALPFEGVRQGETVYYHPKVIQLNLLHEKIQLLSSSCIRATVVTETSKVATWIDDTISVVASKLEHGAQSYSEFQRSDKISQLHTCSLFTCIRLESGAMYWWGIAPFSQRKKNWKRIQSKTCKQSSSGSGSNEIGVGSLVCLKNGPSFGDGAIGFTTKDGIPRVGRLVMSAWNITDTCTFKIIQPDRKLTGTNQSSQMVDAKSPSQRARKMIGQPLDFSGSVSDDQVPPTSPGISKNSSSERLEMPPPPSPASSTCSEPGCSPSHKRKHKHLLSVKDEDRMRDEEQWNLKDVIFLEEVKKPPVAKVIKLDGNTALVRFNQRDPYGPYGHQSDSDVSAYLQDCRMIRKDDLQLAKEATSSSRIIDCQRSPKKLNIADSNNFLTFAVSNNGIHALVKNGFKIEYKMYQLASGRVSRSLRFPTDINAFLGRDPSLITLYASGESDIAVTLRDGNGSLYPLSRDFLDSLREPQPLDMAPIQALSMAIHPLRDSSNPNKIHPILVMAMAMENQILIPAVLRSDPEFVRLTLASLDKEPVSQQIVASEKIDLNRNILHVAVYSCAPTPTRNSDKGKFNEDPLDSYSSGLSRISGLSTDSIERSRSKQVQVIQTINSSPTLDLSSDADSRSMHGSSESSLSRCFESSSDWTNSIFSKYDIDPTEQKQSAHMVLLILVECPILKPYLKDLMLQRDAHGMTPFMSAVSSRAYTAALILFDLAQCILNQEVCSHPDQRYRLFMNMIFPPGTNLDNNPLYMLCANDTCSFTWTGAQHINQDIFECKTCGLTRTLCCCTECARTCHKGHDCRLKKTSPTAYCDCWEKCKCKSLVAGSHFTRFKLLERLLADTELVSYPDSKGESILLFLVQTVGRQMVEQRQYGPDRSSRHNKRDDPADMPDHDLSPPRFARKALHKMLGEWLALKSVIMAGTNSSQNLANTPRSNLLLNAEDQLFLSVQQGTALLDRFTHSILIKIGAEMLDVLLTTIIRESSSTIPNRVSEARLVANRFVRSVARNGVVLSVELSPINYSQPASSLDFSNVYNQVGSSPYGNNSYKLSQQPASILQKCRKVFQALLPIAAEELAEIADALISPVKLGVPRPTAPFSLVNSMAEATQGSEEIFVVEPVVLPPTANMGPVTTRSNISSGSNQPSSNEPPILNENPPASSERDRLHDMLYENELAIEAMDSEDADTSNNIFRPSNNGESDSDSDSNADDVSFQSNIDPSGARSTTTGATVGSEVGASTVAYFSDPDSGDSSNAEEEDEESETNDTEHDNDHLSFANEDSFSFRRRAVSTHQSISNPETSGIHQHGLRSSNLGQQLHWALRHRDHSFYPPQSNSLPSTAARLASIGLANAYTYLDGAPNNRRSVVTSSSQSNNVSTTNELSMSTTAVGLSRAFSIIIRSISDLIPILKESERSDSALTINQLKVSPTEAATIICNLEKKLNPVWEWLFKVMDSTESQLRFGCALTNGIQAAGSQSSSIQSHQYRSSGLSTLNNSANLTTSSLFPPSNLLPVHPAMIARVNANLSAHNLNRRIPNLFDETLRIHNSSVVSNSAHGSSDSSNVRLHNPMSQGSSSNRPHSLTTRVNLANPNYVTRMPISEPTESIDGTAARRDFLSYMISLIRGHGGEHHDSFPILDVSSLRHIAYVFDACIYYLQALNRNKNPQTSEEWSDEEDLSSGTTRGPKHQFFRRSESTLFLDGVAPDPFSSPLSESLPLAEQPHLLQPTSRREDLFGIPKTNIQDVNLDSLPMQLGLSSPSSSSCPKCKLRQQNSQFNTLVSSSPQRSSKELPLCPQHKRSIEFKSELQHTELLGRWHLTVELFGREFLDDVGAEPGSILTELVGFPLKENRFRKEMERLRSESAPREISLTNIDRDRNTLIRQTIKELNNTYHLSERSQSRRNHELPLLACSKVKVSFKDEKGEGNGVARSFYTAFCEAILSNEKLANLDAPLFYQPGLRNFYSPRQADANQDRLNAFRNVGRIIGICLSQSEICPIHLNRHVIKYILRRQISWHDLAFFDPILYESLRQLVVDAETNSDSTSALHSLDLRFCVDLCNEEGGGQVELILGGRNIQVTSSNIYEYVRHYALKRMIKSQEKALQAMRQGVMDVLPPSALDNLTAEDFRLLLNGVGDINVQTLVSYTSFIDDRGTSAGKRNSIQVDEQLSYFKKWFWSIVEKMTTKERQDLVYFWTGSPSLPASEEGFQPMPTVSIRPAEDLHLPTSNVCIFRLYIPLYSSKAILRSKLLIAIKEKNFGFI